MTRAPPSAAAGPVADSGGLAIDRPRCHHGVMSPDPEPEVADLADEVETVDGVPVLDDPPVPTLPAALHSGAALSPVASPAVQAAAAAATGFVAGAATLALVRRRGARRLARARVQRRVSDGLPIVGTRSFLIDVHLIGQGPRGSSGPKSDR